MKNAKTRAGAKPAKPDPRSVPAPTASAKVAEKAIEAIAPTAAVATAEPKKAARPAKAKPAPAAVAGKPAPFAKAAAAPTASAATVKSEPVAPAAAPAPAVKPDAVLPGGGIVPSPAKAVAPLATALEAGADQARAAYARARESGDTLRQAVSDSTTATTRGIVELNGKVLDLIRAQGDATIDLWRSAVTAGSLSEALRAQTSGLRQAYETTAAQWKDIAETATRIAADAAKPLQSAFAPGR